MTIAELKNQIENNQIESSFKIFVCDDDYFLANQYCSKIAELLNKLIRPIKTIKSLEDSVFSIITDQNSYLNVLKTEVFDEQLDDYSSFNNTIVICKKIDKKLVKTLENFTISFPKLEPWQIQDYMQVLCPSLSKEELNLLFCATNGNIYKIINELDKLNLFEAAEQKNILMELLGDSETDLIQVTLFDLADALVKKDYNLITKFLKHEKNFDFDPIAITNIILNTLKKLALIKFNSGATAQDLEVSAKQFYAFKNYFYSNLSIEEVYRKLKFISSIDLKLKSSEFDISKNYILDYIICKLISLN